MTADKTALDRIVRAVESAQADAVKLGTPGAELADLLSAALEHARDLAARGGHPDEGIAPDELTTENDR